MFLLIDFLNIAYRSFHAIQNLSNSKGQPTNAIYGFLQSARKWLEDVKPTHLAILCDGETPKRRLDLLPTYKANRPPMPEELRSQLAILTNFFPLLGWPTALDPDEEADDLGAALAVEAAQKGHEVRIASNDKDFLQILGPKIKLIRGSGKETVVADEDWLMEKWGIRPGQVADFLALVGDSVDNIPGAPGIGEKTATDLIQRFGSLDRMMESLEEIQRPKLRDALKKSGEQLKKNLQLVRLDSIKKIPPLESFRLQPIQYDSLLEALAAMGFKSLYSRYEEERRKAMGGMQGTLF